METISLETPSPLPVPLAASPMDGPPRAGLVKPRLLIEVSEGRDNNIDFLRLVLAVLVILSHSYPLLLGHERTEPLMRLTGGQRTLGEFAVEGFFILSGFLITRSWLQSSSFSAYMRKRILRIYPGFLAAVAVTSLMIGPLVSIPSGVYWGQFQPLRFVLEAINLQLFQPRVGATTLPYNPTHALNGSLWSIRYEFLCYLGVVGLGLIGALRRRWPVVLVVAAAWAFYALQVHTGLWIVIPHALRHTYRLVGEPNFWPRLICCFGTGMIVYLYRHRIPYSGRWCVGALGGLAVLALWPALRGFALALPILGGYVLFYAAFHPGRWFHNFGRRGDLSYGTYLYAYPIQQTLIHVLGATIAPLLLFALALPITLLAAVASWLFVEKPCMSRKAGRSRRPDAQACIGTPIAEAPHLQASAAGDPAVS